MLKARAQGDDHEQPSKSARSAARPPGAGTQGAQKRGAERQIIRTRRPRHIGASARSPPRLCVRTDADCVACAVELSPPKRRDRYHSITPRRSTASSNDSTTSWDRFEISGLSSRAVSMQAQFNDSRAGTARVGGPCLVEPAPPAFEPS